MNANTAGACQASCPLTRLSRAEHVTAPCPASATERREWAGDDLLYDDNWTLGGDEDAEFGVYGLESLGWSDGGPAAVTDTLDAPTAKVRSLAT